jgi:hypothetical protein
LPFRNLPFPLHCGILKEPHKGLRVAERFSKYNILSVFSLDKNAFLNGKYGALGLVAASAALVPLGLAVRWQIRGRLNYGQV